MAFPVAAGRQRVDRDDLVASRDQRPHQQPTIQLHPNHHRRRLVGVVSDQCMELRDPGDPSGTRRRRSTTPAWSSTRTSWWASAQSTPTKINPTSSGCAHCGTSSRSPAAT